VIIGWVTEYPMGKVAATEHDVLGVWRYGDRERLKMGGDFQVPGRKQPLAMIDIDGMTNLRCEVRQEEFVQDSTQFVFRAGVHNIHIESHRTSRWFDQHLTLQRKAEAANEMVEGRGWCVAFGQMPPGCVQNLFVLRVAYDHCWFP